MPDDVPLSPLSWLKAGRLRPSFFNVLYLTDRCPVGCAHCSVSAVRHGSGTRLESTFRNVLDHLARSEATAIAITGGEPLIEKARLSLAVDILSEAGKSIVLFTSGMGRWTPAPLWLDRISKKIHLVIVSTDSFHRRTVPLDLAIAAMRFFTSRESHVVAQLLDEEGVRTVMDIIRPEIPSVEFEIIPPLRSGRGRSIFEERGKTPGIDFGTCSLLNTPTFRFDGFRIACCNEDLISFPKPESPYYTSVGEEIEGSISSILEHVRDSGMFYAAVLRGRNELLSRTYSSICEMCRELLA